MSPEEKKIRKLLKRIPTKPSKPGDVIKLRDGTTYIVGRRGNWIKQESHHVTA